LGGGGGGVWAALHVDGRKLVRVPTAAAHGGSLCERSRSVYCKLREASWSRGANQMAASERAEAACSR